jgi:uncharacterized protein
MHKVMAMSHSSALAQQPDLFPDEHDIDEDAEILCWTDGLLTAVAVGPQGVSMREWMSVVWKQFEDSAETEALKAPIEAILSNACRELAELMRLAPSAFVPKFRQVDDEVAGAMIWADGFRAGMSVRPAAWRSLGADRECRGYVATILLLSLDDAGLRKVLWRGPRRDIDIAGYRRDCAGEVVESVAGIYRYFHRRGAPVHAVGRNDQCPCGSGRKYKKCCMR